MGDQEAAKVAIVEHVSLGFFSSATAAVLFAVQSNDASASSWVNRNPCGHALLWD
jgi:hypothetical protein